MSKSPPATCFSANRERSKIMETEAPQYIDVPKQGLFFVPLGGVGEIGMNFGLYACDDKWIAVDCGVGFAGDRLPGVDMLIPDASFAASIAPKIKALIITHAHEDHIGAVGLLWRDLKCPIYATPFAAEMLETRLDEAGLLGRASVEIVNEGDYIDLKPFEVELVPINHSIPEATSLLIKTPYGSVFHTGDWRFDEDPIVGKAPDYKALKELKKEHVLALVGDSTNVFVEEDVPAEAEVRDSLVDVFAKAKGRGLVVTCFASNVGRLESIAYAAAKNGREVCLMGRSLWRVEGAGRAAGYFRGINVFLTDEEASTYHPSEVVYVCTGCQGEPRSAMNNLSYGVGTVRLNKDDVVVFSSRVIPGNEQAIANLQNRLLARGAQLVTTKDALVHVSGHSGKKDMKKLYSFIQPEIAVPVHGETAHLFEHADLAKECGVKQVCLIKDGDVLRLAPEPAEVIGEVKTGVMAIDGKKIIPVNSGVLRQRRRMIEDGSVVATVVLDKSGTVSGQAQFSAVGLMEQDSPEFAQMDAAIKAALEKMPPEARADDKTVVDTVKSCVRKVVMESCGRRPMVDVHLVRV